MIKHKYLSYKASAGSGKTFALTVRYISLLLLGAKPNEILTLTFTKKAAKQMEDRIFQTIFELGSNKDYLEAISNNTSLSHQEILEQKNSLIKILRNYDISIFTIDKFINKILREFSGYIKLNDDFAIAFENKDKLYYYFLKSLDIDSFDKLVDIVYKEQKRYQDIFEIFDTLISVNERYNVANIDFKQIKKVEEEILANGYRIKDFFISLPKISSSIKKAVDFDSFNQLLDKGKTWLVKDSLKEYSYFKKFDVAPIEIYHQNIKTLLSTYYQLRGDYSLSKIIEIFDRFKEFKKQYLILQNRLSFDDISNIVLEMLSSSIDKDFLYFRLDSRFSHLLIDEFQDTSVIQYRILEPFIQESVSGVGVDDDFKTFFYVGDIKQSIYRFRGGKKELFDYIASKYPQIKVEFLNTNYRSKSEIVKFVNDSFTNIANYDYIEQNYKKDGGYVEVIEDNNLNNLEVTGEYISKLIKQNIDINKTAILTYTNSDILAIYEFLSDKFPQLKIVTEMTSYIIYQSNVSAIIAYIKYIYFQEDIYKAQFNYLCNNRYDNDVEYMEYDNISLVELICKIADKFELFDDNVIRFVEVIKDKYCDILEFVYDVDNLDTPMVNTQNIGLQILTIFKSKGLEFDTVLVIDRLKNKANSNNMILFEYENIDLKNIYYKISKRDNFDIDYKNALDKEKMLNIQDELNILYVALTRAKNNLIVFKKSKKSVFDIIDLTPTKKGNIYQDEDKKIIKSTNPISYQPLQLGLQEQNIKIISEEIYDIHSKYFGLATHYALEMMKDFTQESLDLAMQIVKNRYSIHLNSLDFDDIYSRISKLIQNEEFLSLLSTNYTKEQSILYNNEIKIIDLLVVKDNNCIIIDYKTSQDIQKEHIYQVKGYIKAIKDITYKNAKGYLVYLRDDDIMIRGV